MLRCSIAFLCAFLLAAGSLHGQVRVRPTGRPGVQIGEKTQSAEKELRRRRVACQREIAIARIHTAAKNWYQARRSLDTASALTADAAQSKQIRSLLMEIDKAGQSQLSEAAQSYKRGDYLKALESFGVIARTFGRLPSGVAAGRAMKRAKLDPAAQLAIHEYKAAKLSKRIGSILKHPRRRKPALPPSTQPATAPTRVTRIKQLAAENQAKVVDLLKQMARLYGGSPTGKLAAADLKTLQADEAFTAELSRYRQALRAGNALKKAEMYHNAGLMPKAVEFYKQVVRDFPKTPEAAKAAGILAAIETAK